MSQFRMQNTFNLFKLDIFFIFLSRIFSSSSLKTTYKLSSKTKTKPKSNQIDVVHFAWNQIHSTDQYQFIFNLIHSSLVFLFTLLRNIQLFALSFQSFLAMPSLSLFFLILLFYFNFLGFFLSRFFFKMVVNRFVSE